MLRVKLEEKSDGKLWEKVSDKGVSVAAEETGYSASKIYNWKSKDLFIPQDFVEKFLDNYKFEAVKAGSNSEVVENIGFSNQVDELKTRINCSGFTNSEGTPFYYSKSRGNVQRFRQLMQNVGVEVKVYRRNNRFEVRYPRVVYELLEKKSFEPVEAAVIDEVAEVRNGRFMVKDRVVDFENYAEMFNEDKLLQLGLQRSDPEIIGMVMSRESEKASNLL